MLLQTKSRVLESLKRRHARVTRNLQRSLHLILVTRFFNVARCRACKSCCYLFRLCSHLFLFASWLCHWLLLLFLGCGLCIDFTRSFSFESWFRWTAMTTVYRGNPWTWQHLYSFWRSCLGSCYDLATAIRLTASYLKLLSLNLSLFHLLICVAR